MLPTYKAGNIQRSLIIMDTTDIVLSQDLFALFNKNLYGPEPGEKIDQEGLVETLLSLNLDPEIPHVLFQFKRWWRYWGGSLQLV